MSLVDDMSAVLRIERSIWSSGWTQEDFEKLNHQTCCIGRIATIANEVVGFNYQEVLPDQIRILNLGVMPEFRRQGVGSALMRDLLRRLRHQRRDQISTLVWETNLPAQLFLRSLKFRCVDTHRNHMESGLDAYEFQRVIRRRRPVWADSSFINES